MPVDDETRERVGSLPAELRELVEDQVEDLEQCAKILQEIQSRTPRPSQADIEAVRSGHRPMTRDEYLLARLQRILVALENIVSDLWADLEHEFEPGAVDLLEADINALAAAAAELDHE